MSFELEVAAEVLSPACIAPMTFLAYRLRRFRAEAVGLRSAPAAVSGNGGAGSGE